MAAGKKKIEPGDRFGRWTVLGQEQLMEKVERKWYCRCDCGTLRYVLERSLKYGGSLSCGCLRREKSKEALSRDLTGNRFGELTVICRSELKRKGKGQWWLCKCDCGAEYEVEGTLLVTGRRTRCSGSSHVKNYFFSDITGKKFGRLTALYPVKRTDKGGSMIWHCQCECGNEVEVSYNSLMYANQKSCGCQKKEHDQKLPTYLNHMDGTSVEMLKSKKIPRDNTTGYRGVYLVRGKYIAKIVFQKKQYFLGSYDTAEEAAQARKEAEEELFDVAAVHYEKWKQRAEQDPEWASLNPVQIKVQRNNGKFTITMLPKL